MLLTLAKLLPILLLAQIVIFCGIFFISGQLLPASLSSVYAATNSLIRTVIALLLAFSFGNFLMAYSYGSFPPGLVAPATIFATVIVQIVMTVMILQIRPSLMLIPATALVIASCVWVSILLQQK